ncbi:MAG: hypothetical protein JXB26_02395 [Candidatus Aminicenantes bacterium]|nr:hypothetical protein [Candidatus Aminicenantes bacterium]
MKNIRCIKEKNSIFLVLLLAGMIAAPAFAQKKLQKSPGGYHGELDFPISWKRYYNYGEWTGIMKNLQKKYPHLADIQSIGKSRMGRDQYLLTITAKSTGATETKSAMWVDGAIHGNEVNGITCSLYLAWYLLTRYDYDPYVKTLVDNHTFYILPGLNVDANASYVEFPNTPHNPRETYRPEDNDGDGLYDEDQTEDVDGDGELSMMYVEDPGGDLKLSPDKRRFVPVSDMKEEVRRFRYIGPEGFDNDGDGSINEDDIGGPDPNRNYPYGWDLESGNPYPMSEPETRNVFEFQMAHKNIFASFHYHNTGRLIMFQAPPPSRRRLSPEMEERFRRRTEEMLTEMRKTNKYAQAFDRRVDDEYQNDMDTQVAIVTDGARILKNYRPVIAGLSGQAHAATYYMLGAFSYLIELWGSPVDYADEDGDGRISDEERMKWIDFDLAGEGWIIPRKVKHPDLGEVWIGGTPRKHIQRTPPARYIESEALRNALFVLHCVSQFPKVEIREVRVLPAADNLLWVEAEVLNQRVYPTISDRGLKLERTPKDKIFVNTSNNVTAVGVGEDPVTLDPSNSREWSQPIPAEGAEFRLRGKEHGCFCCLVKMDGSSGWVEFRVDSHFGGQAVKRIQVKRD